MAKQRTRELISRLAGGADLERVLQEFELSPRSAMLMLKGGIGKRRIAELRKLSEIHARLVADRFSTFAVQRLCELLQSEKPELRLKGAISVLTISGLAKGETAAEQPAKENGGTPGDENLTAAQRELAASLAEVILRGKEGGIEK